MADDDKKTATRALVTIPHAPSVWIALRPPRHGWLDYTIELGEFRLEPDADVRSVTKQLLEIPGIGPWTTEYIAMRALHWPDAFPSGDLVLRRRVGNVTSAQLLKKAET